MSGTAKCTIKNNCLSNEFYDLKKLPHNSSDWSTNQLSDILKKL